MIKFLRSQRVCAVAACLSLAASGCGDTQSLDRREPAEIVGENVYPNSICMSMNNEFEFETTRCTRFTFNLEQCNDRFGSEKNLRGCKTFESIDVDPWTFQNYDIGDQIILDN